MPESLAITRLLNQIFSGPLDALFALVHFHPANPQAPITDTYAVEIAVVLVMILFFAIVRMSLSVEKPGTMQQVVEMIHEGIGGQTEQIIGHGYERFQAFVTCIFLFVLTCNLLGLIPGIEAPTKVVAVPLGLAISTFIYYNFYGFREQGFVGYIKHFMGPVWWIAWLLFPIEIISHLARLLSLTVRLWANMFAGDLVTMVFFSIFPIAVPVVFLALHIGVSVIQAFIFMLLTIIYLSMAVQHEH